MSQQILNLFCPLSFNGFNAMRLYLVRHPLVKPDTCYGSSNLNVSDEQCDRVSKNLLANLPKDVVLYSSPLRRCSGLASRLAIGFGNIPVVFDERLAEMHFGRWELRPWSEIPRPEVDAWANNVVTYRPGGGESVLQMAARVREFHDELLRSHPDKAVVVCHAGTIRMLLGYQRGLPLAEMARYAAQIRHKIAFGEVVLLDM
jgi:alpha-ribazole phosphatase